MKRFVLLAVLLVLASCGSDIPVATEGEATSVAAEPTTPPLATPVPTPTSVPAEPTPTSLPAEPTPTSLPAEPTPTSVPAEPTPTPAPSAEQIQRDALSAARLRWQANRPTSYSTEYFLQCECLSGPWRVEVDADGNATSAPVFDQPSVGDAPFLSVEAMFDDIETALDRADSPVEAQYDTALGFPRSYTVDAPMMVVDGGFGLVVEKFTANPDESRAEDRQAFLDARQRWEQADIALYDYTITRVCFCRVEFSGPYEASVVSGEVVSASLGGVDLLEVEALNITRYGEAVMTVDGIFAEVDRAIDEAASYTVEYHAELGYPTSVFIDWDTRLADEEIGYETSLTAWGDTLGEPRSSSPNRKKQFEISTQKLLSRSASECACQ